MKRTFWEETETYVKTQMLYDTDKVEGWGHWQEMRLEK